MKDNFSERSDQYAKYRPSYPDQLFYFIKTIQAGSENAWDCGTGNGQVAEKLAPYFDHIYATDISETQLERAFQFPNIHYSLQPAEKTNFKTNFFDLIMVAQAVHWFDFEKFYAEAKRTAKNNSFIVITGYGRLKITPELDTLIDHFYYKIIGSYWDRERKYVDEDYKTIPFPFDPVDAPKFQNLYEWSLKHLTGYLETWSAVNHYIKDNGRNPIEIIQKELMKCWGHVEKRTVSFPLLLRIGRIKKR